MDNFNLEEVTQLKENLEKAEQELVIARQEQLTVQQVSPQDKFIETLFDKGGEMLTAYLSINAENQKLEMQKEKEVEIEELNVVNVLDKRDKYFKGILLAICIVALVVLALFEKAQSIAPVIGVVIGLLLKTNSITEFFTAGRKGKKEIDGE